MPGGINKVFLCGVIGRYGVEVRYAPSGTAYASFTLALSEQGQEGKTYTTLIPCEVWGTQGAPGSVRRGIVQHRRADGLCGLLTPG